VNPYDEIRHLSGLLDNQWLVRTQGEWDQFQDLVRQSDISRMLDAFSQAQEQARSLVAAFDSPLADPFRSAAIESVAFGAALPGPRRAFYQPPRGVSTESF
jgi:hypothetical protein